jgi:K+-sensing histidine kinase KdpD
VVQNGESELIVVFAISVDDDGPGLPPVKAMAIFDRFCSERSVGEKFASTRGRNCLG